MTERTHTDVVAALEAGQALTIPDVANLMGVHVDTVRRWVRQGLPFVGRGRTRRILRRDLDRWLSQAQDTVPAFVSKLEWGAGHAEAESHVANRIQQGREQ